MYSIRNHHYYTIKINIHFTRVRDLLISSDNKLYKNTQMVLLVTSLQTLFCNGECLYKTENKENKTKHVIQLIQLIQTFSPATMHRDSTSIARDST